MIAATALHFGSAFAGPHEQAITIFNRLNGVPPSPETLAQIEKLIVAGDLKGAALAAIDDKEGNFYKMIQGYVAVWTNEDEVVRVPLNDYSATVLGMIRDEVPFNQVLSGDIVYVGISPDPALPLPAYSIAGAIANVPAGGNDHYAQIEARRLPVHKILVQKKQSEMTYLPPDAAAGILTTRGFSSAYYVAGTNRAATRFALKTFICKDMEALSDTSRPDFRVRKDVTRSPGGDPAVYKNKCSGCHSGMDGMAGAFAFMDWTEEAGVIYNPLAPRPKYSLNAEEFPKGFTTTTDQWMNLWAEGGTNQKLGWNGPKSGYGVKAWGEMITATDAFAQCMSERALVMVCDVDPAADEVRGVINQMAAGFQANGSYNMKSLFAKSALYCRGK
jgi:hypothetical protein